MESKRVKFKDLYDMYPGKWVITVNSEWKNGDVDTCEVFGVYDTEDELIEAGKDLTIAGRYKLVKEEDEFGFIFVATN